MIEAKALSERFPENGDVASIAGAAFLRVKPPKPKDADRELERAINLGCRRPELLANVIQAKRALEDWPGLRNYTKDKSSNEFTRDLALSAYIDATENMLRIARVRGDDRRMAELSLEAIERITAKIRRARVEPSYFGELSAKNFDFARIYINSVEKECIRPGDRLQLFEAAARITSLDILLDDLVRKGILALQIWWRDVESRPIVDVAACKILGRMLTKLNGIEQRLISVKNDTKLIREIEAIHRDLEFRGAKLQASVG